MDTIAENGMVWHRCDHLTNGMRRWYTFRMIGKHFYCSPKNLKRPTYEDRLEMYREADLAEAAFCRKIGWHENVTQLDSWR